VIAFSLRGDRDEDSWKETVPAGKEQCTMYETSIYSIAPNVWRWEIRCGGALLRCGTAGTRAIAELQVMSVVNT